MDDFSWQAQLALQFYHCLPGIYAGMSGAFVGKDYSLLPTLFDIWDIKKEDRKIVTTFILDAVATYMAIANEERKREQTKRKARKK